MTPPRRWPPPQRGDEDELHRLYDDKLHRIVRSRVSTSHANVDDACAFAWLQLLRRQPGREHVFAWLATTAVREAITLDRRARRSVPLIRPGLSRGEEYEIEPASPRDEAGEAIEYRSALSDVAAAHLTDRQKQAVSLLAAGHTYKDIAEITGWTLRTVERQILAGRQKLALVRDIERTEGVDQQQAALSLRRRIGHQVEL